MERDQRPEYPLLLRALIKLLKLPYHSHMMPALIAMHVYGITLTNKYGIYAESVDIDTGIDESAVLKAFFAGAVALIGEALFLSIRNKDSKQLRAVVQLVMMIAGIIAMSGNYELATFWIGVFSTICTNMFIALSLAGALTIPQEEL